MMERVSTQDSTQFRHYARGGRGREEPNLIALLLERSKEDAE
jgi:hypothetical protein